MSSKKAASTGVGIKPPHYNSEVRNCCLCYRQKNILAFTPSFYALIFAIGLYTSYYVCMEVPRKGNFEYRKKHVLIILWYIFSKEELWSQRNSHY
jgi:hypothetical protein